MARPSRRQAELSGHVGQARRTLYEFLAACFTRPPTLRDLEAVQSREMQGLSAWLDIGEALSAVRRMAVDAEAEAVVRQEFMDLLKVPGGRYVAPYESVYRDGREIDGRQVRGLLMGQSAVDVQKWYRLAAVEVVADCKELPDHIGLELAYLGHLCRKEQEFAAAADEQRLTRAREMQRDFLAAHVCSWIAMLRDRIVEKSSILFYRFISELAVALTHRDLATLERALGPSTRSSVPRYEAAAS